MDSLTRSHNPIDASWMEREVVCCELVIALARMRFLCAIQGGQMRIVLGSFFRAAAVWNTHEPIPGNSLGAPLYSGVGSHRNCVRWPATDLADHLLM